MYSDDELVIVSAILIEEEEVSRKRKARFWIHNINRKKLSFSMIFRFVNNVKIFYEYA